MTFTTSNLTLSDLKRSSVAELEEIFASDDPFAIPDGRYRGIHLVRLDNRGAREPRTRWAQYVGFELTPFGIDFDDRRWYFFHPRLRAGKFQARIGPSRWRPTEAVTLHYDPSRLPTPLRNILYDEVKPLTDRLCLGLGGLNAGRGEGDHFFFALERITE
jgi:hypothetical protein